MQDMLEKAEDENRGALLMEVLACTGLKIGETPAVTVENVKAGTIEFIGKHEVRYSIIPECLQRKILQYAESCGIHNGQIFWI